MLTEIPQIFHVARASQRIRLWLDWVISNP